MKILLTGKNGQLGRCFQDVAAGTDIELLAYGSGELNLCDHDAVMQRVLQDSPDLIVNAAAYTAVDKAEMEQASAYAVNEAGVCSLAQAAKSLSIPMIHVSTDYVFDGTGVEPYTPDMSTHPQGVYGASKLAGELTLVSTLEQHVILRTAWVFSEYGNNFVRTMVRLAKERDQLSVVADQYGSPTYAGDLAHAILQFCRLIQKGEKPWGVYHYAGDQPTSWHGFARAVFQKAHQTKLIERMPSLTAISSEEYPTPAKRPEYSVLQDMTLLSLSIQPSNWLMALDKVLGRL